MAYSARGSHGFWLEFLPQSPFFHTPSLFSPCYPFRLDVFSLIFPFKFSLFSYPLFHNFPQLGTDSSFYLFHWYFTTYIITVPVCISCRGKTRAEVMQAIKQKEAAVKRLVKRFTSDSISEEDIEWCLYSIGQLS